MSYLLLLARLIGNYCYARRCLSSIGRLRLSSSVTLPAGGRAGRRARGRSGGQHCTAGQYGYVPLVRHLVVIIIIIIIITGCAVAPALC